MFKAIINTILILAAVLLITVIANRLIRPKEAKIEVSAGRVSDIESMVRLCSVEIYSEVPVLDTIHDKVLFAIQKQRGSISFDLSDLKADTAADTIRVVLPREIIDLYEATDDNSWQVIDTKAIGKLAVFRSDRLNLQEENAVKAKVKEKSIRYLRENGTVARARKQAAGNLRLFLEKIYRRPVIVEY